MIQEILSQKIFTKETYDLLLQKIRVKLSDINLNPENAKVILDEWVKFNERLNKE